MKFRTMAVRSARELVQLLGGLKEEEGHDTLLLGPKWNEAVFRRRIRGANALVSDNDGTVIRGNQWLDLRECMTQEHQAADAAAAATYFGGSHTDADDVRLLLDNVRRLQRSGLEEGRIRDMVATQRPRGGVRDLFRSFPRGNTALVSFGIHAYPTAWSEIHDVPVAEVHALRLKWRLCCRSSCRVARFYSLHATQMRCLNHRSYP